jgi:nitroreductase
MSEALPQAALARLFTAARTANTFLDRHVDDATLAQLYELYKWGPTSMNCQPARVVFVRTAEGKARLAPALAPGNRDKTMATPVTAIVAHDTRFFEHLAVQFPPNPAAADMFAGNATLAQDTAFRNGSLQGAYLILAARALGLDAGPMSGFNPGVLNAAFFPDGRFQANFLVNLGWADPAGFRPRGPRLPFDTAVSLA